MKERLPLESSAKESCFVILEHRIFMSWTWAFTASSTGSINHSAVSCLLILVNLLNLFCFKVTSSHMNAVKTIIEFAQSDSKHVFLKDAGSVQVPNNRLRGCWLPLAKLSLDGY